MYISRYNYVCTFMSFMHAFLSISRGFPTSRDTSAVLNDASSSSQPAI